MVAFRRKRVPWAANPVSRDLRCRLSRAVKAARASRAFVRRLQNCHPRASEWRRRVARNSADGVVWHRTERRRLADRETQGVGRSCIPRPPQRFLPDQTTSGKRLPRPIRHHLLRQRLVCRENRTSSHHVAERLSECSRVLYVDSPGLRAPKATGRDLRKLCRTLLSVARRPRRVGNGCGT